MQAGLRDSWQHPSSWFGYGRLFFYLCLPIRRMEIGSWRKGSPNGSQLEILESVNTKKSEAERFRFKEPQPYQSKTSAS
jgi:hypothetical protein